MTPKSNTDALVAFLSLSIILVSINVSFRLFLWFATFDFGWSFLWALRPPLTPLDSLLMLAAMYLVMAFAYSGRRPPLVYLPIGLIGLVLVVVGLVLPLVYPFEFGVGFLGGSGVGIVISYRDRGT